MITKNKKSSASRYLEQRVGPLTLQGIVDAIRLGEDWTKREMAEKLGVSPTYYSDFIAGKKPVSPRKAAAWAKILGYDERQFVKYALQDLLNRQELTQFDVEVKLSS